MFLWFIAIVSFLGSLGTLIPVFADLLGHPIKKWSPRGRIATAAAFLLAGIITGTGAYLIKQPQPGVQPQLASRGSTTTDQETTTETAMNVRTVTEPAITKASKTPVRVSALPTPTTRSSPLAGGITDDRGSSVPELLPVSLWTKRRGYTINGDLHETIDRSPELQDLYTVNLTLQARIMKDADVVDAFNLTSRGGGIRIDDARAQALNRLTEALRTRVQALP